MTKAGIGRSEARLARMQALADSESPPLVNSGEKKLRVSSGKDDWDSTVSRLALLDAHQYDLVRKDESKRLERRVTTLDDAVKEKRQRSGANHEADSMWSEPLHPTAVCGSILVQSMIETLERHLVLPEGASLVIAMWCIHTHCLDACSISPVLALTSPEKRCGKTSTMSVIDCFVVRPLPASNITPSALFRACEEWTPTLLIDEADTFLTGRNASPELRGVINSGHTRSSAYVVRNVPYGDGYRPQQFSTWSPKVIGLIGDLPGTIQDRAIVVRLRRKRRDEIVDRLPIAKLREYADHFRSRCARWALDYMEDVKRASPQIPACLNDRASDNWYPLFQIAEVLGGDWLEGLRATVNKLAGAEEDDSVAVLLLNDLHAILGNFDAERISSSDLADRLVAMEERPWPDWSRGKPITARQIAKLLNPFGITSKQMRTGKRNVRGYYSADLKDALSRYAPASDTSEPLRPLQSGFQKKNSSLYPLADSQDAAHKCRDNAMENNNVADVAGEYEGEPGEEEFVL